MATEMNNNTNFSISNENLKKNITSQLETNTIKTTEPNKFLDSFYDKKILLWEELDDESWNSKRVQQFASLILFISNLGIGLSNGLLNNLSAEYPRELIEPLQEEWQKQNIEILEAIGALTIASKYIEGLSEQKKTPEEKCYILKKKVDTLKVKEYIGTSASIERTVYQNIIIPLFKKNTDLFNSHLQNYRENPFLIFLSQLIDDKTGNFIAFEHLKDKEGKSLGTVSAPLWTETIVSNEEASHSFTNHLIKINEKNSCFLELREYLHRKLSNF